MKRFRMQKIYLKKAGKFCSKLIALSTTSFDIFVNVVFN